MAKWRPEKWTSDDCGKCPEKQDDEYGLYCDLSCGKASARKNFEAGADAILDALRKTGEHYEPGYYPDVALNTVESGTEVFIPDDTEDK